MPATPSSDNTVLVLYPPRLPGATEPVIGAHCGVPKRIYDLEPMGARVDVDPYPDQQAGDTVLLNLNGQMGIDRKVTQSDSDTVTLYIPKKLLLADRVNQLTYTVMRGSQNEGISEPPLELLYNLVRPGNEDRDPGVDGHSELELLLPDDIRNGVGPDFPDAGVSVCVSYPYCRAFDVIRLNLNGHDVYHTVTKLQAPLPGTATPVQVCFNVTRADLAMGGDNAQYKISYTVTDQVGNGPDTDSPWSATQVVDVDLDGRRLVAPDLAEDPDDPSDDPSTIDLTKLGKKDLTVLVHVFAPLWQVNDEIRVTYIATPPTGPMVNLLVTATVSRIPFTYRLMVPNAKVLPDSLVQARYELIRNNVVVEASPPAVARVIGNGAIDLRPPFLVAPATSPIDVLAYANGVTVRVEHLTAVSGDRAQLIEVNPLPGSEPFPSPALNANHRANFNLNLAFLAARQGRGIELTWTLIRNLTPTGESLPLQLRVNPIANGDIRLPPPVIPEAGGLPVLNLAIFAGNASVTVTPWRPLITLGQRYWLRIFCTKANGSNHTIVLADGLLITAAELNTGLNRSVERSELLSLLPNSELRVVLSVTFNGSSDETQAVIFRELRLTVTMTAELIIDRSQLNLLGLNLVVEGTGFEWPLSGVDPVGTNALRPASGGQPPYTYRSSDDAVASVDNDGVVRSVTNGTANITAIDALGHTASYTVVTSNVMTLKYNSTPGTYIQAAAWVSQVGGIRITPQIPEYSVFSLKYLRPRGLPYYLLTGDLHATAGGPSCLSYAVGRWSYGFTTHTPMASVCIVRPMGMAVAETGTELFDNVESEPEFFDVPAN